MQIRAEEISQIIRKQIESYDQKVSVQETGTVLEVGDGIARVYGLEGAMAGELLEFPGDVMGLVLNLEEDNVGVALFGDYERDHAKATRSSAPGSIAQVPVGEALLGRVVNALGEPIDGKGPIETPTSAARSRSRRPASSPRKSVNEPLQTGIKAIDAMIPIGRGQRELIIGDRQTGKTAVAIDTIINQKGQGVYCIYVAIGQKQSTVAAGRRQAAASTARWSTRRSSPPAPRAGAAAVHRAVHRRHDGRVLPRQRPPRAHRLRRSLEAGRRLPPALAAPAPPAGPRGVPRRRLLPPLAACSSAPPSCPTRRARGSLTALPIIETQAGDVSAYIPTNVISITDGQIFLETRPLLLGRAPGRQRRHLGQPRRRHRADQGDEEGRRHAAPRPGAVPRAGGVRAVRLRPRQGDADSSTAARAWSSS